MSKTIVLTGVGRDRVGIVAELTRALYESGCNLLDSSMTLLRGEFAIILMLQAPENQTVEHLSQRLRAVEESLGLTVHMRELTEDELAEPAVSGVLHMISVYGADKPGIVSSVTRAIADLGVNITDVETKAVGQKDKTLFVMILEVEVPETVTTAQVDSALKKLSAELKVDITLQRLEVFEL